MAGTQPAHEMSRELVNMLTTARDQGDTLTLAEMREELGVGHEDLDAMLDQVRQRGIGEEVAPGEWTLSDGPGPEGDGDGRVSVHVPEPGEEAPEEEAREPVWEDGMALFQPTVRLTRAIATRLEDEALGQLVKAGLEDTPEGSFLLEIVP